MEADLAVAPGGTRDALDDGSWYREEPIGEAGEPFVDKRASTAARVRSLDAIVKHLSGRSWVSESSEVEAAVESLTLIYGESRARGYLAHDLEGNKHVIDRVLDAATGMLRDGDPEGAALMQDAREALAEGLFDQAEALVRATVEAYD